MDINCSCIVVVAVVEAHIYPAKCWPTTVRAPFSHDARYRCMARASFSQDARHRGRERAPLCQEAQDRGLASEPFSQDTRHASMHGRPQVTLKHVIVVIMPKYLFHL